jgi:preprotein translocase subunit YajC
MGNEQFLAVAKQASGGSSFYLLIGVVAIVALMYFMMIRPQRNRQRQIMQAQSEITPGTKVRTTAGMYATVVAIEDGDVVLEVAPGVNVRYMRRAIMDVVPPETDPTATEQSVNGSGAASEGDVADAAESDFKTE